MAATAIPSVTFATRSERQLGLPTRLLLIEDSGGEQQFVLDLGELSPDGDAAVKAWTPGSDPSELEVVARNFGSFLLQAATEATA